MTTEPDIDRDDYCTTTCVIIISLFAAILAA